MSIDKLEREKRDGLCHLNDDDLVLERCLSGRSLP
jgi:hypothetical protein